ncbi:MAG: ribokinase [Clostridia bacterium]|nr:ribokinase [Clostridia bacterium]
MAKSLLFNEVKMMKILNFGSMNIDKTYLVDHFVQPGETKTSLQLQTFSGGKGLNQSIALALSGSDVYHLGCIGPDGVFLVEMLKEKGVCTDYITSLPETPTGHAIIQVDNAGQNCILLFAGANRAFDTKMIDKALENFSAGDWILLQNETNELAYAMNCAKSKKMKIAFNPSPADEKINDLPLNLVDLFFINETEGATLTGETNAKDILDTMLKKFPDASVVLTLGKRGSIFRKANNNIMQPAFDAEVKDTTGACDTYTGFFLANYINGAALHDCMQLATMASTIQVTREGAATAIPTLDEVKKSLTNL